MATRTPRSASLSAMPRPMPRELPVIRACFPLCAMADLPLVGRVSPHNDTAHVRNVRAAKQRPPEAVPGGRANRGFAGSVNASWPRDRSSRPRDFIQVLDVGAHRTVDPLNLRIRRLDDVVLVRGVRAAAVAQPEVAGRKPQRIAG